MKRVLRLIGGIGWFVFAVGFACFLVQYIAEGAGLQFYIPVVSSGSILVGLVHVVGLCTASVLCFVIGTCLCAHALVPKPEQESAQNPEKSMSQPADAANPATGFGLIAPV